MRAPKKQPKKIPAASPAVSRPAVVSTLVGCQTRQHVRDAVSYLTLSEEELDYAPIISNLKHDFRGSCVYCNHCRPCPSDIDIAMVNKYLDIAKLDENNVPPSIRQHYRDLSAHGSDCVECGSCEERCPFGVRVIENMQQAAAIFES